MFKPLKQPLTHADIEEVILQYAKLCHQNDFGTPLPESKAYEIRRSSVNRHIQTNHPELPDSDIDTVLGFMFRNKLIRQIKEESIIFPVGVL